MSSLLAPTADQADEILDRHDGVRMCVGAVDLRSALIFFSVSSGSLQVCNGNIWPSLNQRAGSFCALRRRGLFCRDGGVYEGGEVSALGLAHLAGRLAIQLG